MTSDRRRKTQPTALQPSLAKTVLTFRWRNSNHKCHKAPLAHPINQIELYLNNGMLKDVYCIPTRMWTVLFICSWKFRKIQENSIPTDCWWGLRRDRIQLPDERRNYLEFFRNFQEHRDETVHTLNGTQYNNKNEITQFHNIWGNVRNPNWVRCIIQFIRKVRVEQVRPIVERFDSIAFFEKFEMISSANWR